MRNRIARQCRDPLDGGQSSPKPCRANSRVAAASLYEVPGHVSLYTNGIACHVLNPTGVAFYALACRADWAALVVEEPMPSAHQPAMRAVLQF